MGWWTDLATPQYGCPNQGGAMLEWRGVVLHIAEGYYEGTISWQMNPASQVSSHFIVAKDGRVTQMVDTDVTAWTQRDGNGHWLSIECEGFVPDALTDAQADACARLLARANQVYNAPLQVATSPQGRGLGHHSMGEENGYDWGHPQCPGPNIIAQKPDIVVRAEGETMSAKDVWNYDIDPDAKGTYTAGGAQYTMLNRTAYLANGFAPQVMAQLEEISADLDALKRSGRSVDPAGGRRAMQWLIVLILLATVVAAVGVGMLIQQHPY